MWWTKPNTNGKSFLASRWGPAKNVKVMNGLSLQRTEELQVHFSTNPQPPSPPIPPAAPAGSGHRRSPALAHACLRRHHLLRA
ncbi:hypothetical protein EJB05_27435, partial [Eragrostis curvula]